MIDLDNFVAVRTALFVRIDVEKYAVSPGSAFVNQVLAFSDHVQPFVIDDQTYLNLGNLLNITASQNELRTSANTVTITLSGIPNSAIAEIVNSQIKSAPVSILRGYFNSTTTQQIGTVQGRFRGFVNNFSLQEDYDVDQRTASNTLVLQCSSSIDVLSRKHSGRRTNPESQRRYFADDASMDRVPTLEKTTFDFGAPK